MTTKGDGLSGKGRGRSAARGVGKAAPLSGGSPAGAAEPTPGGSPRLPGAVVAHRYPPTGTGTAPQAAVDK